MPDVRKKMKIGKLKHRIGGDGTIIPTLILNFCEELHYILLLGLIPAKKLDFDIFIFWGGDFWIFGYLDIWISHLVRSPPCLGSKMLSSMEEMV